MSQRLSLPRPTLLRTLSLLLVVGLVPDCPFVELACFVTSVNTVVSLCVKFCLARTRTECCVERTFFVPSKSKLVHGFSYCGSPLSLSLLFVTTLHADPLTMADILICPLPFPLFISDSLSLTLFYLLTHIYIAIQ